MQFAQEDRLETIIINKIEENNNYYNVIISKTSVQDDHIENIEKMNSLKLALIFYFFFSSTEFLPFDKNTEIFQVIANIPQKDCCFDFLYH